MQGGLGGFDHNEGLDGGEGGGGEAPTGLAAIALAIRNFWGLSPSTTTVAAKASTRATLVGGSTAATILGAGVMVAGIVLAMPANSIISEEEERAALSEAANKAAEESLQTDESAEETEDVPMSPPEGTVENPDRPGSWGVYDENGKFREGWRLDRGRPEIKRGHGSVDHIHIDGSKNWTPVGD